MNVTGALEPPSCATVFDHSVTKPVCVPELSDRFTEDEPAVPSK